MAELNSILVDASKKGGIEAVFNEANSINFDFLNDVDFSMALLRDLRRSNQHDVVKKLAIMLGQRYIKNIEAVTLCFDMLHRSRSWNEALDLLNQAKNIGVIKNTDSISVVEADCLKYIGRAREAVDIINAIDRKKLKGIYSAIYDRLVVAEPIKTDENVAYIENYFSSGNVVQGVSEFQAFLTKVRQLPRKPGSVRDVETSNFSNKLFERYVDSDVLKKIRLVSDSIALSRPTIGVDVENTYPWVVQDNLFVNYGGRVALQPDCKRGRGVKEVLDLVNRMPEDLGLIIQVGIVDCAPRVFSEVDISIIKKEYGDLTAESILYISRRYRDYLQGDRKVNVYMPISDFEENLEECLKIAIKKNKFVAVANIVTPSRLGGKMIGLPLSENISEYNYVMNRVCDRNGVYFIDFDSVIWGSENPIECFSGDNYHYNSLGHKLCGQYLSDFLDLPLNKFL